MAAIQFVDDTAETALSDAIGDYQSLTNRTLGNADGEMLLINAFAYRLSLVRGQLNWTGNQNLITSATGASLDQLGLKNGTFRLLASAAVVTLQFTVAGGTATIPAGTRVKTNDGAVIFATNSTVTSGAGTVSVDATATITGIAGNGYGIGYITQIVDPVAYVTAVTNTDASAGGSDEETDDAYRARIPLANGTFSTAGPEDGYLYIAKTASASIADVSVVNGPEAGAISTSTLGLGGTGYAVGDLFTVTGGAPLAQGVITGVAAGVVTSYRIYANARGLGYSVASGVATLAVSGGGSGLTIDITAIVSLMVVTIYPLLNDGTVSGTVNNLVLAACSDIKVRPLNDFVVVASPTAVNYALNPVLKLYKNAPPAAAIIAQVTANLAAITNQWTKALNYDVKLRQIQAACMVPGVYDIESMSSFTADITIDETHYGYCTGILVTCDPTPVAETY